MLNSLEFSNVKSQVCAKAESADQSDEMTVETSFVRLTQDELDIIRWEGEGGQ